MKRFSSTAIITTMSRVTSSPRTSFAIVALGLVAQVLLPGCGERESSNSPNLAALRDQPLQRLELTPVDGAIATAPEDRLLVEWPDVKLGGAIDDWDFGGAKTKLLPLNAGQIFSIFRKAPVTVSIPTRVAFSGSPQVNLKLLVRNKGFTLRGTLRKDGETVSEAALVVVRASSFRDVSLIFDLVEEDELLADELVLHIPPGDLPIALEALAIVDVPLGGQLPEEAFGGFSLVHVGRDSRVGTVLTSMSGLEAEFTVEDSEQELAFSYVIPESVLQGGEQPRLRVEHWLDGVLTSDPKAFDLDFASGDGGAAAWRECRIPVGEFLGEKMRLRFVLDAPSKSLRLAVLGQPHIFKRAADPPTVLLITSDTHRADHLGFVSGEEGPRTDFLDRLAEHGVSFLDTTSSINNTTPSHVSLFTGLTPRDTGIVANAIRLSDAAPTLADRFAELGYATLATVSAAPVTSQYSGLGQGFDRYSNPKRWSARDSRESIEQLEWWLNDFEGRPLFAWVHLYDAHSPYAPPEELIGGYYPEGKDPFDPLAASATSELAPKWNPDVTDLRYIEALYDAEVHYVDDSLEELMKRERFWNGTIAFTADHGETMLDGGELRFNHVGLAFSNLAVPLIFRARDLNGGEQRHTPVNQIDVGRTLLDIAGHPQVDFPGENLLQGTDSVDPTRYSIEANGYSAAALEGQWMLQLGLRKSRAMADTRGDWFHEAFLYDIEADEACRHDLSSEHPERTAELRRKLVTWLRDASPRNWQTEAKGSQQEVARQLAELGYVSVEREEETTTWFPRQCECEGCSRFP